MKLHGYILLILLTVASCSKCSKPALKAPVKPNPVGINHQERAPDDNSTPKAHIIWDKTGRKISHTVYFAEYARVKRWNRDTLLLIYHYGKKHNEWDNIALRKSYDNGKSWSAMQTLMADNNKKRYYGFSTPEITRLKNGWLLLAYTGRGKPDDSTHNNLQVRISKDIGTTWSKPAIVAIGRSWEPGVVQLPDGDVQIVFSTEIMSSKASWGRHEQKVVVISSKDNGLSWSKPKDVSFVKGARDGMSVPLVLNNKKGIVTVVESVHHTKSPCIIWSSLNAKWQYNTIGTTDNGRRWDGIDGIWGGAPYLIQLPSGETIISVQDVGGRKINRYTGWKKNTMLVFVGNSMARNFTHVSYPWPNLPLKEGAYFNSLFLKDDSTVVAISTRNYANTRSDIWWKEGHVRR